MSDSSRNRIFFFGPDRPYGQLSNFYPSSFYDHDTNIRYNCNEQYFMHQKCLRFDPDNENLINDILESVSPAFHKNCGRKVGNFDKYEWNSISSGIMKRGLMLKFSQNESCMHTLLITGNSRLFEASQYDRIWGIGYGIRNAPIISEEHYGENRLGKLLMEVREELRLANA
jgi:ribA/ribD-fused uncharacterized protein